MRRHRAQNYASAEVSIINGKMFVTARTFPSVQPKKATFPHIVQLLCGSSFGENFTQLKDISFAFSKHKFSEYSVWLLYLVLQWSAIQSKIKLRCFQTKMFSVSHYYKLKGFERDYIQILRLSQKKNSQRPTILTMFSPVKRSLVFPI